MLRYERKVADNPILVAYSKAYKRFNSRTRAKKMTQSEFLNWSEQARKLRDDCLAGKLPFVSSLLGSTKIECGKREAVVADNILSSVVVCIMQSYRQMNYSLIQ